MATSTKETSATQSTEMPTSLPVNTSDCFKMDCSFMRASRSLDVEVDVRVLAAPIHLDRVVVGRPQARVRLERLFRAGHVDAVDRLKSVAALEAPRAEQRVGSNTEEADAADFAVLRLRADARRS